MTQQSNPGWEFIDDHGTFRLDAPDRTGYLYFPLVNPAGMMSTVTPLLHGDAKTGQNSFLLEPTSVEDLHASRAARNFWVTVAGHDPWSCTGNSAPQIAARYADSGETVSLEAGLLWQRVIRHSADLGLRATVTSFVPASQTDAVELMQVVLENTGDRPLSLTPTAAIPIYGRSADNLRDHRHVTSLLHRIRTTAHGVLVRPTLSFDERGHTPNHVTYGVLGVTGDGAPPERFCPVVEDFTGEGGTLDWPEWIVRPANEGVPAGVTFDGYEAIGALRFAPVTLAPGEQVRYILLLAILDDDTRADSDLQALLDTYGSADRFDAALAACQAFWQDKADRLRFQTGDPAYAQWLTWVTIQPLLRRLFGNSFLPYHDYGRGGRGWRDLWQDCLALLLTEPDDVPDLLYSSFAGVRFDGSNATIIGSKPGQFVADRNNIPRVWMDHGVWPFLTTRLYLDQTGDLDFLLRPQAYFKDRHIYRCQAHDQAWSPEQGTQQRTASGEAYQGSILEHLLIQHLTAFFNVGEHHILRLEGADWNDGMDMARTRGESVAFTALYAGNLRALAELLGALQARGLAQVELAEEVIALLDTLGESVDYADRDAKHARLEAYFAQAVHAVTGRKLALPIADVIADLTAKSDWLAARVREQEWITNGAGYAWFNGYYDDDGQRVEGDHPLGVRMTLTGQVFPLMSGVATEAQTREIVRAADHYLWEPSMGGHRLNTDFGTIQLKLGRCFGYAFGHKENGAMFSHMAVMYANALYQRGLAAEGHRILDGIYRHCADFPTSRIYPGIPEYVSARGRGLYPYLTGSASWLLLTLVMEVFGVRGSLGDLALAPRLLAEQFDVDRKAAIELTFAGKRLHVTYHNPARLTAGQYRVGAVTLDGQPVACTTRQGMCLVPRATVAALAEGQPHHLAIILEEEDHVRP